MIRANQAPYIAAIQKNYDRLHELTKYEQLQGHTARQNATLVAENMKANCYSIVASLNIETSQALSLNPCFISTHKAQS
jgi:hypothetical protein